MKILAFAQYGSLSGGSNRSFLMVLKYLKEKFGHDIHVVLPEKGALSYELEKIKIEYDIVPIHEISGVDDYSIRNIYRFLRYKFWSKLDKKSAQNYVKNNSNIKCDVIYINDTNTYLGCFIAELLNVPYVWHFRSYVNPKSHYIKESKEVFKNCSKIIAISNGMKNILEKNPVIPKNKISMIYNGIPLNKNNSIVDQRNNNEMHFLQCGRITEDKGHKDAILALKILKEKGYSNIYLHIVGSTPENIETKYSKELKDLISKLNLKNQIIFEGTINDMTIFRKKMNGELMCSICEPFGRVTLEGMRSGLVVIGSDTGGTPEIINDNITGLLYKQGSPESLSEKIEIVYKNKDFREKIIRNAIEFSLKNFTPEMNVSMIEKVLKEVIKKNKGNDKI